MSAARRLPSSTTAVVSEGCSAGFACFRRTVLGVTLGAPPLAWTYGCTRSLTTIGLAAAGRFRPGTWTSLACRFGAEKSGGVGPAVKAVARCEVWWLR